MYKLVEPNKIPKAQVVKEDQLLEVYKLATGLSVLTVKEQGIGLSANQAGIPLSLFIVKNNFNTENYFEGFTHYVNCSYEPIGPERYESMEGCLSLKDKYGNLRYFIVERPDKIRFFGKKIIAGPELHWEDFDVIITKEFGSSIYCHEVDHCNNILISDIGKEVIPKKKR